MSSYEDLTEYKYSFNHCVPGTKNVGWIDGEDLFEKSTPDELFLACLWNYCKIAIAKSRGGHLCELCADRVPIVEERNGERLLLGSAEIRVISRSGIIYSSPNAIYHYVARHKYRPPDEFVEAVLDLDFFKNSYFQKLIDYGFEWVMLDPHECPRFFKFHEM